MRPFLCFVLFLPASALAQTQTDTTFAVAAGSRLEINPLNQGELTVTAWDRQEIRVQATHPPALRVAIQHEDGLIKLEERRPVRAALDEILLRVSVPSNTRVTVVGTHAEVTIVGVEGGISVTTNQGNVTIRNATGPLKLQSSGGEFTVEDVTGIAQLRTTARRITVRNLSGDLTVETVAGDIELDSIQANRVEATSHAGNITYRGTIEANGLYDFASNRGNIVLHLPNSVSATVTAGTVSGEFTSDFPMDVTPVQGEKFTFTLGTGTARIELITHRGSILLRRAQ